MFSGHFSWENRPPSHPADFHRFFSFSFFLSWRKLWPACHESSPWKEQQHSFFFFFCVCSPCVWEGIIFLSRSTTTFSKLYKHTSRHLFCPPPPPLFPDKKYPSLLLLPAWSFQKWAAVDLDSAVEAFSSQRAFFSFFSRREKYEGYLDFLSWKHKMINKKLYFKPVSFRLALHLSIPKKSVVELKKVKDLTCDWRPPLPFQEPSRLPEWRWGDGSMSLPLPSSTLLRKSFRGPLLFLLSQLPKLSHTADIVAINTSSPLLWGIFRHACGCCVHSNTVHTLAPKPNTACFSCFCISSRKQATFAVVP